MTMHTRCQQTHVPCSRHLCSLGLDISVSRHRPNFETSHSRQKSLEDLCLSLGSFEN